jgi:hypothetical protein
MKIKIDLDKVQSSLSPQGVTFTIAGKDYALRDDIAIAEVMMLDSFGNEKTDEETVKFIASLFAGDPPHVLAETLEISNKLNAMRRVVAEKNPSLSERLGGDGRVLPITTADVNAVFGGKLPKKIADFSAVENRYSELTTRTALILSAIVSVVSETTPKNFVMAAAEIIRRQIQEQRPSSDSPGST